MELRHVQCSAAKELHRQDLVLALEVAVGGGRAPNEFGGNLAHRDVLGAISGEQRLSNAAEVGTALRHFLVGQSRSHKFALCN